MKRIRRVLIHGAYIAALIDIGACSSEDGQGASGEVQAAGEGHDLRFSKQHHEKKKKKHHWDDCDDGHGDDAGTSEDAGAPTCLRIALHVDSIKHREDTQKVERTINVQVPETLDAWYWGKRLEAKLTLQQGDKRVTCTYAARRHKLGGAESALELQSCDNGAKAGASIAVDSAGLTLECSELIPFAKVSVELPEAEPCGGTPPTTPECDPTKVDDGNPCTRDFCGANGAQHEPLAAGSSCADSNVCNGAETCDGQGACKAGAAPTAPSTPAPGPCQRLECNAQSGWVLVAKPAGTSCVDDDVCNGTEACNAAGACVPGTPLECDDADPCNGDEQCDSKRGCLGGDPPTINDGNPCTADACNADTGITHISAPDNAMLCGDTASCQNGVCKDFT